MSGIFLVEYHAGWIAIAPSSLNTADVLLVSVLGFLAVGVNEEFTFRGYQIRNLAEGVTCRWIAPRWAVLIALVFSSAFFGLAHAANPNATLVSTLNIVMGGLVLSLPYVLTGELAIPIGLHITWNLFQGTMYGFPVSGSSSKGLIRVVQSGPEYWTGGAFGPEAGLLAILFLLIACALIVVWVTSSSRRLSLHSSIALYGHASVTVPSSQTLGAHPEKQVDQTCG
jgi:hypothetical protein